MDAAQTLREISQSKQLISKICTVESVGEFDCEVIPVDSEATLPMVRMKAHLQGNGGIIIKPKVGSFVIVSFTRPADAFIAMCDEIDSIQAKLFDHTILINKDGMLVDMSSGLYEIKNNQESLKKLLSDLIKEITMITVTTGTGPSGVPINIAQLKQIGERVLKLLK